MDLPVHRKAYHRLILPTGEIVQRPVILFDASGEVISWHQMKDEEPFTEWVGGEYHLL